MDILNYVLVQHLTFKLQGGPKKVALVNRFIINFYDLQSDLKTPTSR